MGDGGGHIHIGNLHPRVTVADLEPKLIKYGTITNLWVAKNPPGFAFCDYQTKEMADACVKGLDGHRMENIPLTVEIARRPKGRPHGRTGRSGGMGRGHGYGGGGWDRGRDSYRDNWDTRDRDYRPRRSRSRDREYRRRDSRSRSPRRDRDRDNRGARDYYRKDSRDRGQRRSHSRSMPSRDRRRSPSRDRNRGRVRSPLPRSPRQDRKASSDRRSARSHSRSDSRNRRDAGRKREPEDTKDDENHRDAKRSKVDQPEDGERSGDVGEEAGNGMTDCYDSTHELENGHDENKEAIKKKDEDLKAEVMENGDSHDEREPSDTNEIH